MSGSQRSTSRIVLSETESTAIEDTPIKRGVEQLTKLYQERLAEIEEMERLSAAKSKIMNQEMHDQAKKHAAELEEMKKRCSKEMEDFLINAKRDSEVMIFEARLKMAEEAAAHGFNISIWDINSWKEARDKLMGKDLEAEKIGQEASTVKKISLEVTDVVMREIDGNQLGNDGKND